MLKLGVNLRRTLRTIVSWCRVVMCCFSVTSSDHSNCCKNFDFLRCAYMLLFVQKDAKILNWDTWHTWAHWSLVERIHAWDIWSGHVGGALASGKSGRLVLIGRGILKNIKLSSGLVSLCTLLKRTEPDKLLARGGIPWNDHWPIKRQSGSLSDQDWEQLVHCK